MPRIKFNLLKHKDARKKEECIFLMTVYKV